MAETVMVGGGGNSPKSIDKNKIIIPAAIAAGVFVIVIAVGLLLLFGGSTKAEETNAESSDIVEKLIESYAEVGVEITEEDVEVTTDEEGNEVANVSEEVVADTAVTISTSALNSINDLYSGTYGSSYSYKSVSALGTYTVVNNKYYGDETDESTWEAEITGSFNNQNANSEGKDSWTAIEDITNGDGVVDLDDVLDYINNQLDYIKYFIDKNCDFYQNGPYDLVTQEVLEAAWSGDLSGTYSDINDYTHAQVFSCMLAHIYTRMEFQDTLAVWDNSTLLGMVSSGAIGTDVLYNTIANKIYEVELTRIDYVVEDDSLTCTYLGNSITSSYMALCNGYKVYLDASLSIIDIV